MNEECKTILTVLQQYLEANPSIRFCQALTNLRINEFADVNKPARENYQLRDNYNDLDIVVCNRLNVSELVKLK